MPDMAGVIMRLRDRWRLRGHPLAALPCPMCQTPFQRIEGVPSSLSGNLFCSQICADRYDESAAW